MSTITPTELNELRDLPYPLSSNVTFGKDVTLEQAAAYWQTHEAQQAFFALNGNDDSPAMVARSNKLKTNISI